MARFRRLRARLLRWDAVASLTAMALPFAAAMVLGFVWLWQNGLFLWFVAASAGFGGIVLLSLRLARRAQRRSSDAAIDTEIDPAIDAGDGADGVAADPGWTASETEAFDAARSLIRSRLTEPLPWDEVQGLALEVVNAVAARSGARGKTSLDFSLPEALLLIERVAGRFRTDLRDIAPFVDSLSLSRLHWLWRNRRWLQGAAQAGQGMWRLARILRNPPVGIVQEIERLFASGYSTHLSSEGLTFAQTILLEEVAKAAVDLYSGRLRYSDAELLAIQAADAEADRARMAMPDAPVRIVVAGQVSAGKSSLINALIDETRAEADAMPTTDRAAGHALVVGGTDCVLIDLPGIDGGKTATGATLAEMDRADMVLWLARANRPARAVDADVLDRWRAAGAADPARRMPPLIAVLSCADTLAPDWPYPEHRLPHEVATTMGDAVRAAAADLGTALPIPVSAEPPVWNLDALERAIAAASGEALMVQRNRARLTGGKGSAVSEIARNATGLARGAKGLSRRWRQRGGSE